MERFDFGLQVERALSVRETCGDSLAMVAAPFVGAPRESNAHRPRKAMSRARDPRRKVAVEVSRTSDPPHKLKVFFEQGVSEDGCEEESHERSWKHCSERN